MVAWISSGWLHRPRRPSRASGLVPPLSSCAATTAASGAVASNGGSMWRRCATAPPGAMRSSRVAASSSYVRRDLPLNGSPRGFLATPSRCQPAGCNAVGASALPRRPCARRLGAPQIASTSVLHLLHRIGSPAGSFYSLRPFLFFFPCTWLTRIGKR